MLFLNGDKEQKPVPVRAAAVALTVAALAGLLAGCGAGAGQPGAAPETDQQAAEEENISSQGNTGDAQGESTDQETGSSDASADTGSGQEASDTGDETFEKKDYMDSLSQEQKEILYCVMASIRDGQEANNHRSENADRTTGRDLADPLFATDEEIWYAAYCMIISPGLSGNYELVENYQSKTSDGQDYVTDTYVVPEVELNELLELTCGARIFEPEKMNTGSCMEYEDGKFLAHLLDDWVNAYCGFLKIEQISPGEVMIYGVTGYGNIHYYCESSYDPHKWDVVPDYDGDEDFTTIDHSFCAKATINESSPCGLTIEGIQYDDPVSAKIAADAGIDFSGKAYGTAAQQESTDESSFVLPASSREKLSESDIENLSADQLRMARNEIYARHGRKFKDKDLQAYFEKQSWYIGIIDPEDFSDDMLSDLERENANLLKKAEERKKKQE
ncbi:MAG: YARHG domain-containing protein [Lachnospiraceae bacterium]|nr:YARHG domain-containing protein [Lachnospiraceae bacterium]